MAARIANGLKCRSCGFKDACRPPFMLLNLTARLPAQLEWFAIQSGILFHNTLARLLPFSLGHPARSIPRRQASAHRRCGFSADNPSVFPVLDKRLRQMRCVGFGTNDANV